MALTQQAEVPQIVGAEAADITLQGKPWVFHRLQQFSMPKSPTTCMTA
jgi:branched-chain amino acid transport system substrate-binding protein